MRASSSSVGVSHFSDPDIDSIDDVPIRRLPLGAALGVNKAHWKRLKRLEAEKKKKRCAGRHPSRR